MHANMTTLQIEYELTQDSDGKVIIGDENFMRVAQYPYNSRVPLVWHAKTSLSWPFQLTTVSSSFPWTVKKQG
jgi:hypothetical protein